MAREVLAYADYKTGAFAKAEKEFDALSSDHNAPRQLRARATAMAALVRAGGETNSGHVPPASPQTEPPQAALPPNL